MLPERRTVATGTVVGAAALAAGYLVTYTWKAAEAADALRGINLFASVFGGEAIPVWKAVAWLYFNAHFVPTAVPVPGGPEHVNFVRRSDDTALVLLFVVVPVLLVVAGFLVARSADGWSPTEAAADGATVVTGYLPLVVAVAVLSRHAFGGSGAEIGAELVMAVALAGVAYPVIFGVIGGLAAGLVGGR